MSVGEVGSDSPLGPWSQTTDNPFCEQEYILLHNNLPRRFPAVKRAFVIQSYFPITVREYEVRAGHGLVKSSVIVYNMENFFHRPPPERQFRTREAYAWSIFYVLRLSTRKVLTESIAYMTEAIFNRIFQFVYQNLNDVIGRDGQNRIKMFLDGDRSNLSLSNIKLFHVADAITIFINGYHHASHIEIFDDVLNIEDSVNDWVQFCATILWYFFGVIDNRSRFPVVFIPSVHLMREPYFWFISESFQSLQHAKQFNLAYTRSLMN